jgi:hypothetical protein
MPQHEAVEGPASTVGPVDGVTNQWFSVDVDPTFAGAWQATGMYYYPGAACR